MTNMVWITTQFEGYHKYLKAPKDVYFLTKEHRHMFKLKVWIEVMHNNRDIEFIMFKHYIEEQIKITRLDDMSCEMISDLLYKSINNKYPNRDICIEVSEDGENGSYKEYLKGGDL